jgi:tRNA pseudouridine38-40 synthase
MAFFSERGKIRGEPDFYHFHRGLALTVEVFSSPKKSGQAIFIFILIAHLPLPMKFFIHLAYKGSRYFGWQRQPKHISVQETLEDALEKMLGKKTNCIGCGRTDTGVHASQFYCHIKVEKEFDFDPVFRLNKMLPDDIAIHGFIPVDWNAHAQHDAVSRTYTYRIHTHKDAFLSEVSSFYTKENMDVELMKKAVSLLPHHTDYRSFCKQPNLYKSTVCNISKATLEVGENGSNLVFEITANRFLWGMVRLLVGNILAVGYREMALSEFEDCLKMEKRASHVFKAHPQGLYLSGVVYGYLQ